jgi:hypothetical protein
MAVVARSKHVIESSVFVNASLTATFLVTIDVDLTVMDCDQDEQEQTSLSVARLHCFTQRRH